MRACFLLVWLFFYLLPIFQCIGSYEAEMGIIVGLKRQFYESLSIQRGEHCRSVVMRHASTGPAVPSEKCIMSSPPMKARRADDI